MNFWKKLNRPILALAPMADVTDPAYRKLIAEIAPADVFWTEFVSADGLYATRTRGVMPDSENPLVRDLKYSEGERPIVAQFFGNNPETIAYAATLAKELGFDGVDINMGCPDRAIEKQGAGAAMMKTPEKVAEIVAAAREGGLPVSVKTRIGYNRDEIDAWIPAVLATKPDALTVHLRTRKEMSLVPAHWELASKLIDLRDTLSPETILLGNGDIKTRSEALAKIEETGIDGVMLGRGIFGNPWLFSTDETEKTKEEKLLMLIRLAEYFDELRPRKSFHIMKKHFKAFVHGWHGAAEDRARLMEAGSLEELKELIKTVSVVS